MGLDGQVFREWEPGLMKQIVDLWGGPQRGGKSFPSCKTSLQLICKASEFVVAITLLQLSISTNHQWPDLTLFGYA